MSFIKKLTTLKGIFIDDKPKWVKLNMWGFVLKLEDILVDFDERITHNYNENLRQDKEIADIKKRLDNLESRMSTAEGNIFSNASSISSLNSKMTTANSNISSLQSRVSALENK